MAAKDPNQLWKSVKTTLEAIVTVITGNYYNNIKHWSYPCSQARKIGASEDRAVSLPCV
mgnify:CR=1 FL=1